MKVLRDGFITSLRQEHSLRSPEYREESSKVKKNKGKNPYLFKKKIMSEKYAWTPFTTSGNGTVIC